MLPPTLKSHNQRNVALSHPAREHPAESFPTWKREVAPDSRYLKLASEELLLHLAA